MGLKNVGGQKTRFLSIEKLFFDFFRPKIGSRSTYQKISECVFFYRRILSGDLCSVVGADRDHWQRFHREAQASESEFKYNRRRRP